MSLPTTASKPSQMSIRSFFQAKPPQYALPPSSKSNGTTASLAPVPPPPQSLSHPQSQAAESAPPPDSTPPHSAVPSNPDDDANHNNQQQQQQQQQQASNHPRIPLEASIRPIAPADVNALRRLNALLLPVSYPETFYNRAADPITGRFSRLILWSHQGEAPKPVGGVVCRVEPDVDVRAASQTAQNMYIQSLCLLAPYRSLGLVSAAIDDVVAAAVADSSLDIRAVTAHVWTENEEGLHWYEARGFRKQGPAIQGYYLKLRPDSAWLVSKPVSASVLNALPSAAPPVSRPDISSTTAAVLSLPPMASQTPVRPPARVASGKSFQTQRPETEWNDLPADMAPGLLGPPKNGSEPGSGASSRSSSTVRRKKDRSYPAAAFGQ